MQILADRALIDECDGACRERLLRLRALRDLAELLCVVLHNSNVPKQSHACIPENCHGFLLSPSLPLFFPLFQMLKIYCMIFYIIVWEFSILFSLKYFRIKKKSRRERWQCGVGRYSGNEFNHWHSARWRETKAHITSFKQKM